MCLVDGELDNRRVRQVVQRVISERRRGYLTLLKCFKHFLKLDHIRRTADVESAVALSPDIRASVHDRLKDMYGSTLAIRFAENPMLIGGMRIRVGSDVYDGSVRFRLVSLEKSL